MPIAEFKATFSHKVKKPGAEFLGISHNPAAPVHAPDAKLNSPFVPERIASELILDVSILLLSQGKNKGEILVM